MTTTADVAKLFLQDVGAPTTPDMIRAVSIWISFENSNPTLRNNPLNLHSSGGLPGQVGSANVGAGDRNVAVFDTIEHGVAADAGNLVRLPYYRAAVAELRSGDAPGFLAAIAASPWSAGHYRTSAGTGNKLLNAYQSSGAYNATGSAGSGGGLAVPSTSILQRAIAATPASAYGGGTVRQSAGLLRSPSILAALFILFLIALAA